MYISKEIEQLNLAIELVEAKGRLLGDEARAENQTCASAVVTQVSPSFAAAPSEHKPATI